MRNVFLKNLIYCLAIILTVTFFVVAFNEFSTLRVWVREPLLTFDTNVLVRRNNFVQLLYTFGISAIFSYRHIAGLVKIKSIRQVQLRITCLVVSILILLSIYIDTYFWVNLLDRVPINSISGLYAWDPIFVQVMHFVFWFSLFYAFKAKPEPKTENNETPPNEN